MTGPADELIVTAPNGVDWKRHPGGTSSALELLAALAILTDSGGRIAREWNWWQDGRRAAEDKRIWDVISQWDHAAPPPDGYLTAEQLHARLDASQAEREREGRVGWCVITDASPAWPQSCTYSLGPRPISAPASAQVTVLAIVGGSVPRWC